jgi:hypothetical protein
MLVLVVDATGWIVAAVGLLCFAAAGYAALSRRASDVGQHPVGEVEGAPGAGAPSHRTGRDEDADPSGSLDDHGTR